MFYFFETKVVSCLTVLILGLMFRKIFRSQKVCAISNFYWKINKKSFSVIIAFNYIWHSLYNFLHTIKWNLPDLTLILPKKLFLNTKLWTVLITLTLALPWKSFQLDPCNLPLILYFIFLIPHSMLTRLSYKIRFFRSQFSLQNLIALNLAIFSKNQSCSTQKKLNEQTGCNVWRKQLRKRSLPIFKEKKTKLTSGGLNAGVKVNLCFFAHTIDILFKVKTKLL